MSSPDHPCPTCGASLAADAPRGLCPGCLLKQALAASSPAATTPRFEVGPNIAARSATTSAAGAVRLHYFGDYELIDEIARGGMGVVYRARQVSLNRIVAVKMILSGQLAGEAEVKRFRVEAEAAANLQHPHIVAIHEIGEHEGRHYFSMDYIAGKNLAEHAHAQPLSARETAQLVKQLAEAVHYAHQRGTLHRDLKPQNVLIDAQGQPHITDFGLAKRWDATDPSAPGAGAASELTHTGAIMGSPSYMAPEQAAARLGEIGPATDVYSLGAILYQLLTGQPPHRGNTALETLQHVMGEEPEAPRRLRAEVPPDLETICLKCLEKNPGQRYANARQLAEELGRFLKGEPIQAKPAGASRKVWSWALRHPWAISGAASLIILGLGFCTYGLWQQTEYLAWLSANRGREAFVYWPAVMRQELPPGTMWVIFVVWMGTMASIMDFELRRSARAPFTVARLGTSVFVSVLFIGTCLWLMAKVVKISVWTDAPTAIRWILFGCVQPMLWGGLQMLWQLLRALQQHHSGVEPPPDFLSMKPGAPLQMGGPFSYRRAWRANVASSRVRIGAGLPQAMDLAGPMLTALVVLGIASFWVTTLAQPLWVIGALPPLVFVHYLAGVINPRWIVRPTAFDRLTPNAVRFSYALAVMTIGTMYALILAVPHSPGLRSGTLAGLAAGCGVVWWRWRKLRRAAAVKNPLPAA